MNKLYYSFFNDCPKDFVVESKSRQNYINEITDFNRKNQSFYAWKLLEYAINQCFFGEKFDFCSKNGRWQEVNNKFYFSISHSKNLVCVIVSDTDNVGIDAELVSDKILGVQKLLLKKSITFSDLYSKKRYLTKLWTKKESIYKSNGANKGYYRFIRHGEDEFCIFASAKNNVDFKNVNFNKL